jgi:archaellum component FlaC
LYYYISLFELVMLFNKGGVVMALLSTWTVEDKERLKGLILHHLSIGGSVLEACQQFEFETNGRHKAKSSRMRWLAYVRWTCKEDYRKALKRAGDTHSAPAEHDTAVHQTHVSQEVNRMDAKLIHSEDESSTRLLNAVSHILEDRRQLKDDVQEHKKLVELAQRKVKELEGERKQVEHKLLEKDSELQKQERLLVDTQYKFQQVQDDYHQLMATRNSEYERLQQQIGELQANYEAVSGDYASFRRDSSAQVERLEGLLRNAEMRNAQLAAEAEGVRKENTNLTRRITEFAQQISNVLGQSPTEPPSIAPVPIRPTLANAAEADERAKA